MKIERLCARGSREVCWLGFWFCVGGRGFAWGDPRGFGRLGIGGW